MQNFEKVFGNFSTAYKHVWENNFSQRRRSCQHCCDF